MKSLLFVLLVLCLAGFACTQSGRGLFVMRWVEKPMYTEDMQDVPEKKRLHFDEEGIALCPESNEKYELKNNHVHKIN